MILKENPDVLVMGSPLLFQVQPAVDTAEIHHPDFQRNLTILKEAQFSSGGIGIAGPQVGWAARVFTMGLCEKGRERYPQAPDIPFSIWINPEITALSEETCWGWEGCLSVPGMRGWVERPKTASIKGLNPSGEVISADFDGFAARVMLHEFDHLNGRLYPTLVEDTSLIIPDQAMAFQEDWPEGWPTENARKTLRGTLSDDR